MALGALVAILLIGALVVYLILSSGVSGTTLAPPSEAGTATETATITPTSTATLAPTAIPSFTPQPPLDYTVRDGDTCLGLSVAFSVSVQSIVIENQLPASCVISVGKVLKIPYPTATPAPPPTDIPNAATQTAQACEIGRAHV